MQLVEICAQAHTEDADEDDLTSTFAYIEEMIWYSTQLKILVAQMLVDLCTDQLDDLLAERINRYQQIVERLKEELVAPLTVIKLYRQLIVHKPDKRRVYVQVIIQQAVRLEGALQDLINISLILMTTLEVFAHES